MVQDVKPPLCIARIQWINMLNLLSSDGQFINEEEYQKQKDYIISILKEVNQLNYEGGAVSLKTKLDPIDNDVYSQRLKKRFVGRESLIDYFDKWYQSENKILWLTGNAGVGKTALAVHLASIKENVAAVHFCKYNDSDRANPKKAITTIAFYLSTQIKNYEEQLREMSLDHLYDYETNQLFRRLIIEPLNQIPAPDSNVVVIIDALDEATINGKNELAKVLTSSVSVIPHWLKFLITSREENLLKNILSITAVRHVSMEDSKLCNNTKDISSYLLEKLGDRFTNEKSKQRKIAELAKRSEGVFLYAKTIVEEIESGNRTLDDIDKFPQGIAGVYFEYFERIFLDKIEYFKELAQPILQVLCSSYMPVSEERLVDILAMDEEQISNTLDMMCEMFPERNGIIEPIHKSIVDWLTTWPSNTRYRVRSKKGHHIMASFCLGKKDNYSLQFVCRHLILAGEEEDLERLYTDMNFWMQRKKVLGVDVLLQCLFAELSLMQDELRERVFNAPKFRDVLFVFSTDLFNKGMFIQLKKLGFSVDIHMGMNDKDRVLAMRSYYINGDYTAIADNLEIFNQEYEDKSFEPLAQNMLGLTTKKCGMISQSAGFYSRALELAAQQQASLERIIYYNLNLSRVQTILCRFDEARETLDAAVKAFFNDDWRSAIEPYNLDFASCQLELAVRYVIVETELFSSNYDKAVCEEELHWADDLYSDKIRIDRYYPRHLLSKVLFLLREHRFEEIQPIFDELKKDDSVLFDDVRTDLYYSLFLYATGQQTQGQQLARQLLNRLSKKQMLLIEKAECQALLDVMENQDHSAQVSEELRPWYHHTQSLILQIMSK